MIDERDIVQRAVDRLVPPEPALERLLRRRDRTRRNQRIAAGAVGIAVFVGMIWVVATRGAVAPTKAPVGSNPTVAPTTSGPIPGLPPEGATPSAPGRGELVLSVEGSTGGPFTFLWVYADGRLIWHRQGFPPEGADGSPTGLFVQRLTPAGIEFLRSEIVSTGMFDHRLALARGADEPMLSIVVRDEDRLVRVSWAWRQNGLIPPGSPTATPEQARTLEQLHHFLTFAAGWPASVWEEQEATSYVPSTFLVCFRGFPREMEPSRALSLLPERAKEILEAGVATERYDDSHGEGCFPVALEQARTLAEVLDEAGIERNEATSSIERIWLKYLLQVPDDPQNELWISFLPTLPDGDAIFLGPG